MKIRIGVIFGGKSDEHEVSLLSAMLVLSAIDRTKYDIVKIGITRKGKWLLYDGPDEHIPTGKWQEIAEKALAEQVEMQELVIMGNCRSLKDIIDFAFPVLHGPNGEDGSIQGVFEMIGIPYAGGGILGSAVAMDKVVAKNLFVQAGLPTCPYRLVEKEAYSKNEQRVLDMAENSLQYPIFVKPANMGSSVGMTKAKDRQTLAEGIREAARYDRRIILEQGIDAHEMETGVIGNYVLEVAEVGEIVAEHEFYDYEAKYRDDSGTALYIPADIPETVKKEIQEMAKRAYEALNCCGFARVDFFREKVTGKIFVNEINSIPGFTKYSMFPLVFKEAGRDFAELTETIIRLGFERYHNRQDC